MDDVLAPHQHKGLAALSTLEEEAVEREEALLTVRRGRCSRAHKYTHTQRSHVPTRARTHTHSLSHTHIP
eukprot:6900537-Prymnesium_polylepis.1